MVVEDWELACRYLVHDRDTSFAPLDGVLKSDERHILRIPPHAPQCNAHAEWHVREIRQTLDNLILLGEPHLRRTLGVIQEHHISVTGMLHARLSTASTLMLPQKVAPVCLRK